MTFRTPSLVPLIFIVATTLMLCGLGTWQLERLAWKNSLIESIARAQTQPVVKTWPEEPYRRVELKGRFIKDKALRFVGRPQWEQGNGYFMLVPFKLADGSVALVNRGWAPSDWKGDLSAGNNVVGIARPPRVKRLFTPANHPDKNIWMHEDIAALSVAVGAPLKPFIIEQTGQPKPGQYPVLSDGKINLRNDHLGYAITWFMLAAIGLMMFVLYHREEKKQ